MIRVTNGIALAEADIEERFIRAGGPGGQNVNKVATAVQLRFDAAGCPRLPRAVYRRLVPLAGRLMTRDGVIVITAAEHRSQEQNRNAARGRLLRLLRRAAIAPKTRKPTRPGRAARERRLEGKKRRSQLKQGRSRPTPTE